MDERGYLISPEFVKETFETSILKIKTHRPTNYTCFKDPNCNDFTEEEYEQVLGWYNNFTVPNLNDTINFMSSKMSIIERPFFIEEEPEEDLRPPPELN